LGTREEDIAGQKAEVRRQKANLDRMKDELVKTDIRAPISGFITRKHVEVGQWIQRGGRVADIINIDSVLVRTGIREKDISHVSVGDRALVRVDAYPGRVFEGKVKHIIPQADVASRSFPVKIEVANPDFRLKGGMFARVTLFYGAKQPVLMVPKDALSQLGLRAHVFIADKGRARLIPVKTGRNVEGYVEILEGELTKGDRVIVTGNESLKDRGPIMVRAVRTPDGKVIPVKGGGGPPGAKRWGGKPGGGKSWGGQKAGGSKPWDGKKKDGSSKGWSGKSGGSSSSN
jgi:RND family efflux transporter MFP subunit